jgi:hypothetical protein
VDVSLVKAMADLNLLENELHRKPAQANTAT